MPTPHQRRLVATGVVTALACGTGGAFLADDVVHGLGNLTGHDEATLRALGWCWGGLPWCVVTALVMLRGRFPARPASYLVVVWLTSAALLIPARGQTGEDRFGTAGADGRAVSFGWACGFLAVAVTLVVVGAVAVIGARLRRREVTKAVLRRTSAVLTAVWLLAPLAGLAIALAA